VHRQFASALISLELGELVFGKDGGRVTIGVTNGSFAGAAVS